MFEHHIRFIMEVNRGECRDSPISISKQNDTTDLDFNITGSSAKYLELAEVAPYSEPFGRNALNERWISVYDFAKWIWKKIIENKEGKYGDTCKNTILLLYITRWEFLINQSILHCLIWTLKNKGCRFYSVYLMQSGGDDLNLIYRLYPNDHPADHPRRFRDNKYKNLRPGENSWCISEP
ncbi:MAG: hypothetical protein QM656_12925 [Paracoccaceae bacterium]